MQKLVLFASLGSLAVAGWLAWEVSGVPCEVRTMRAELDGMASLESRIAALEARLGGGAAGAPRTAEAPLAGSAASADSPPALAGAPTPLPAPPAPAAALPAEVEKRIALLEDRVKAAEAATRSSPLTVARAPAGFSGRSPRFYGRVEDAKDDLGLTDPQASDFERIVADARRDLDDLRKTPDDDGKTWEQAQKETFQASADGVMRFDMTKLASFRAKTIPGRSETYGQAEARIRTTAKNRLRDTLTTEQRDKFDKAMVDPLLGSNMGPMVSFTTVMGADDSKPAGSK